MPKFNISFTQYSLQVDDTEILSNISVELAGDVGSTAILAKSGTGKSCFLKSVARLLDEKESWSEDGHLAVNGTPVDAWDKAALRRKAMYVPQKAVVFGNTVADNLIKPQKLIYPLRPEKERVERARIALEQAQLADVIPALDLPVSRLGAGGQQQRLALARAFVLDPDCLMLDEPTSALDAQTSNLVSDSIFTISREKPVIVVTHDLGLALKCDRVLFLHSSPGSGARLIADGAPARVFRDPALVEPSSFMMAWEQGRECPVP